MTTPRPSGPSSSPVADHGPAWRPAWGTLVLALGLAVGWVAWWVTSAGPPESPDATPAPALAAAGSTTAPVPASWPLAGGSTTATAKATPPMVATMNDDLADHVPPGEAPSMGTVIQRLNQAGVTTGLGAFSPPGTSPPLVGLAVPPDFPLPDGYVRHHQTTDDGQDIEPILMFAPDRTFYDSANRPIALPADRVVPPEWAPPGLPIRRIVVPPPLTPGRPGP